MFFGHLIPQGAGTPWPGSMGGAAAWWRMSDGRTRFYIAVQSSRLAVYSVAGALAVLAWLAGILVVGYREGIALLATGILSALLVKEAYRRGLGRPWGVSLSPLWLATDIALITWAVYLTEGLESPWFIWYLSNAAAAAFVGGRQAAFAVGFANSAAYIGVLVLMGEIRGLDRNLWIAASRMGFLYGASFFFLRAVVNLQQKQRLVKRLQEEQEQQVSQLVTLTQDLDQGTRALAEANVQIREADRMKSQFLANMSHELRTPLNSIIGFSEILSDRLAGQMPEKYVKFLFNIHASGQHLLGIINDILDLSKVEAGKMEVHPDEFRVRAVIDGVLNVMHGMASKKGIVFHVDSPDDLAPVQTDPAKLKQILYNLLSNAVKFSPERSTVRVRARCLPAASSAIGVESMTVSVIDTGIGISPADQEVIFHEFRQADGSSNRSFGGTGLGLAIVKKFVELQGGLVRVQSDVGRGSTFTVTLPLRVEGVAPEPSVASLLPPASKRILLVVEDDAVAFQTISRSLSSAGYAPVRARNGEEALVLARDLNPAAITLDLALPGLSGWDVLKALKGDPATREIPVVIISLMDNRELGLAFGADDYFVKPVDRVQLVRRLLEIAPTPPTGSRKARLLLIDDEPGIDDLLGADLSSAGYVVDHALSGAEGLELAARARPDAIILDLMMPDVTGFEVAAALKEHEDTAHVPIVVLTAKDLTEAERCQLQGKIEALVRKGHRASSHLVAAIQDLESRLPSEPAGAR